ncbi:hypothetical protein Q428_11335 [Fervidicella metallireducens AeB]|uniref:ribonucleoside-diphosphate reductase n=1 Tax=Fervidicella metallireducens AeB TaxID=1403537 RepID=A0A017RT41_9CLOT|nr:TIGR03905 family TSCPD domain-containing protein [Fervidicella metallireducens]EYE87786.1 hypothetical protein Q428_11335 [Fervidicella metallireducens AeB]
MFKFIPQGVCSSQIVFDIIDGKVKNVKFSNGCTGNLQGIASLIDGMEVNEAISRLKGIKCRNATSCPDQLAIALEEALNK